jgi:hypothetical protein
MNLSYSQIELKESIDELIELKLGNDWGGIPFPAFLIKSGEGYGLKTVLSLCAEEWQLEFIHLPIWSWSVVGSKDTSTIAKLALKLKGGIPSIVYLSGFDVINTKGRHDSYFKCVSEEVQAVIQGKLPFLSNSLRFGKCSDALAHINYESGEVFKGFAKKTLSLEAPSKKDLAKILEVSEDRVAGCESFYDLGEVMLQKLMDMPPAIDV